MSNVVTAPDAIQPATIDFSALMAKAMEHPAGNETAAAPAVAPETPTPAPEAPAQVAPTPAAAVPVETPLSPAEAKILDLPADALVRAKIDGKEEVVPVKDYLEGISREAVFTKRMQSLAEQRKQAEAELASKYAELQSQAQAVELARSQITDLLQRNQTQQVSAPGASPVSQSKQLDPGEIATMGDVQSTLEAALAKIQAESKAQQEQFVKALGEAGEQVQKDAALNRDAQLFTEGLRGVMAKPELAVLKKLPYPEESLRYAVAAMNPQTIQEAVQFAEITAKGWVDGLKAEMVETAKRQEVAKAQAKLEPPAGSPPAPATQYKPGSAFSKSGKFDWDALRARADAMMG